MYRVRRCITFGQASRAYPVTSGRVATRFAASTERNALSTGWGSESAHLCGREVRGQIHRTT